MWDISTKSYYGNKFIAMIKCQTSYTFIRKIHHFICCGWRLMVYVASVNFIINIIFSFRELTVNIVSINIRLGDARHGTKLLFNFISKMFVVWYAEIYLHGIYLRGFRHDLTHDEIFPKKSTVAEKVNVNVMGKFKKLWPSSSKIKILKIAENTWEVMESSLNCLYLL